MNFLAKDFGLFSSEEFETIYDELKNKYEIRYQDLFMLCAQIGFRKKKRKKLIGKGKEFRSSTINARQKACCYSILFNASEFDTSMEGMKKDSFQSEGKNILEEYANGGMAILVSTIFKTKWNGKNLDSSYKEYDIDLMSFIKEELESVPF